MQAARWPPRLSFGTMSSSPYRYPNAKELLDAQVEGASVPGGPKHPVTTSRCVCVKLGDTIRCICANRRTHSGRMKSESGISGRRNGRDANTAARRRLARLDMGESCFSADTSADLSSAAVTGDFLRAPLDLQCLCATADVIQSVGENTSSTEARPHFETSAKTRSLNQAPGNFTAEPAGVIKSRYHLATPRDVTECMSLVKSKFLRSSNVAIQTKSKILARRIQAVSANKLRCKTKRTNGTIQRPGLIDSIGGRNDPALGLFPVEADVIEGKRLNHPLLSSRDHDANYSPSLGEAHPVHHSRPLGKLVFPPQTWAVGENTKTLEAIISDVEMVAGDEEASQRIKRLKKRGRVRRYTESHKDDVWLRQGQKYTANYLTIPDPSNQKLNWTKEPLSVLIIRKHLDETVMIPFRDLVIWLVETKKMVVFVEQSVMKDSVLKHDADFKSLRDRLSTFKEGDDLTDKVDFIICLGGDGTLLYVSSLFQRSVPPVMAFNMGSLGFLTPFRFGADYKTEVSKVMQGSASLLLRYRLKCVVVRHDPVAKEDIPHVKNIQKEDAWTKIHKLVLNEVVVDRGPSSYLCNLELYIENRLVTSVQGDGLIISTPSGSTAYAVAAGASMIHPSVPCILITPICPHSLSFRPIVVPAGVELKVNLSPDARGTAMVSFDGRDRKEIHQGDSLRITTAAFPVPSICAADQIEDWFDGLANCLNWNIRHHQRPLQNASSFTSIDSLESPDPQFVTNNSSSADKL